MLKCIHTIFRKIKEFIISLHDVDKNSLDRGAPTPNHSDVVVDGAVKAHGTNSVVYTTDASPRNSNTGVFGGVPGLVGSGTTGVSLSGGAGSLTTTSVPHGLGYPPIVIAALNDAAVNGIGSSNIFLPTWISTQFDASVTGIDFTRYLSYAADKDNVYIYMLDALGGGSPPYTVIYVTYYLYRQPILLT